MEHGGVGFPAEEFPDSAAQSGKPDGEKEQPPPPPPLESATAAADGDPPPGLMPIRAPVSEDLEDGGSVESGESFDSALERIAGSSTASFDTAVSPRGNPGPEEEILETARVMPKAVVTSEDKHSGDGSTTVSDNDEEEEDGENGNESTGETGMDDEEEAPMPVAKVTTEDAAGKVDIATVEAPLPEADSESAQGLRVLGADSGEGGQETLTREISADSFEKGDESAEKGEEILEEDVAVPDLEGRAVENEQPAVTETQQEEATPEPVITEATPEPVITEENPEAEDSAEVLGEAPEEEPPITREDVLVNEELEHEAEQVLTPRISERLEAPLIEDARSDGDGEGSEQVPETESEDEEEDGEEVNETLRAFTQAASAGTPTLGSAGPSLPARPTPRPVSSSSAPPPTEASRAVAPSSNPAAGAQTSAGESDTNGEPNDENQETREKLHLIRVKFLRLAQRLGQSVQNVVVAQVLYRLGLAEQLRGSRGVSNRHNAFSFERASSTAEEQEAAGESELDFTCTIMVLGKSGVGKSATINSLFDEVKAETNAFAYSTKKVQEITGTVHGIKIRVIDTPGLLPAVADQRHNEKVMASVKRFIKKSPPDIVLYFDRLDMQSRDYGDLPLLRTITDTFGAAIWFNAIVVLTHASSAPPDGPNGLPLSYEMFVAQRSHVVQQTIRQAAGDMRLMNPVSLVENHSACRTNRAGERVLPNGQIWKPQLLLLCFASKILAEANTLLKLQENTPGKPFGMRSKVPPLPFLLSSLLQSRQPLKHPDEVPGEEDATDDDMDEMEDSDEEEEYDQLPPFRRLTREELEQLDKKNRAAYTDELHLREKLFRKKQWKEELRRRKEMRRRAASSTPEDYLGQAEEDDEARGSAPVPVPLPDMVLPPSFDSDNPTHRYRSLETATQWMVRPVLEAHGWDHDNGYDGLNLERMFVVKNKIPASISGQVTKDKKDANLTMECAASLKHGEGKVSQASFDVQTVGKDLSYTLRSETRFNNMKKNKTIAGAALTMIGDTLALGLKLEDRLMIGKRLKVVMNGGALTGKGDKAYGGTVEISLRDKDFPIGRTLSTLGFSVMNWHGDVALGGNLQSQFMVGRTMIVARGNLNNRGAGQITIKASSSEQLQMALVGIVPLVRALVGHKLFGGSQQV